MQTKHPLNSGMQFQSPLDERTRENHEATYLKNVCVVYAKRYFKKNVPLQPLVSSTRDATFKKQVASRLRETLVVFENCALVYAKHYFFASRRMGLSRQAPCASWKAAPRRPEPATGQSCHFFLCTLCGKMACKFWLSILASAHRAH